MTNSGAKCRSCVYREWIVFLVSAGALFASLLLLSYILNLDKKVPESKRYIPLVLLVSQNSSHNQEASTAGYKSSVNSDDFQEGSAQLMSAAVVQITLEELKNMSWCEILLLLLCSSIGIVFFKSAFRLADRFCGLGQT